MSLAVSPSALLTTVEAARVVDRDERTVRYAIAHQQLPAAKDNDGHWLLRPEDVMAWNTRARRLRLHCPPTRAWDRAAALLSDYGSLSAEELAELLGIHVGNARKHLAILAKQGRARRLGDGQWVLIDTGDQGTA